MASLRIVFASVMVFSAFLTAAYGCTGSTIAAFNIQVLGKSKMDKPEVVEYLKQVTKSFVIKMYPHLSSIQCSFHLYHHSSFEYRNVSIFFDTPLILDSIRYTLLPLHNISFFSFKMILTNIFIDNNTRNCL